MLTEAALPPSLIELKRRLAGVLARSKLDYTDDILILNAFIRDFRWEEGVVPERIRRSWEALLGQGLPQGHMLSIYLHIPYCAKKCHFCYCATEISTNQAVIDKYVPELRREIDFFAPLFENVPVGLFQVGGGTPNALSAAQLRELLGAAMGRFCLEQDGMRIMEFNPANMDREKLEVVREAGFNRISFGVQSLDGAVLERENREYQTYEMTRDAVRWAQDLGFEVINVDLLLGLANGTLEGFLESFRRIAELAPTTIMVPGVTMTDAYLRTMKLTREENQRRYEALLTPALEGLRRLGPLYGYAAENLTPNHGIWVLQREGMAPATLEKMRRGDLFHGENCSILGIGHHARSTVFGEAVYQRYPQAFAPGKPVYRAAPMTRREEMMRYIIYTLENRSRVEFDGFQNRFGRDLREEFSLPLRALRALDKVRVDSAGFTFFPVRGSERIFFGMFFLMDLLAESSFAAGSLDASLRGRLDEELAGLEVSR